MKREQVAAVQSADTTVRGEMGQADARRQPEVGATASDPVLNELRSLRAEIMMQRLVTERAHAEAPPSYSGHGGADDY